MYKLFLCVRFLRSKVMAYLAVLGFALCVAMMLIVVSVMNGFLDKIERAAKGLYGDIVMEGTGGIGRYDEFIALVRRDVPQVEAASPFILTLGMLRVPGTEYQQYVNIAGIRLGEQVKVTSFAGGLFVQRGLAEPTFDPPISLQLERLDQDAAEIRAIRSRSDDALTAESRFDTALRYHRCARVALERARPHQRPLRDVQDRLNAAYAAAAGESNDAIAALEKQLEELKTAADYPPPDYRVVLGLGIPGLSFRTAAGETVRIVTPGAKVLLSLVPMGQTIVDPTKITPTTATFMVVDDCKTDVAAIDSKIVYIPFDTLQRMYNMSAQYDMDGNVYRWARCSQVHFRVRRECSDEAQLARIAGKIRGLWREFAAGHLDLSGDVSVKTWRQAQANLIGTIESQRTLTVVMFGVISLVAVVLIFVIFYTIVVQKTKDIGVLKALGASSSGVGWIFLVYGVVVGLVGSIIGTVLGYFFVRNINPIQDWVADEFGFRVWSRETFMFDQIPSEVDWPAAGLIVLAAMAAGLIGAIVPAVRAARMQPVEALRYE